MKLIIAFLIIGAFAILETGAESLRLCLGGQCRNVDPYYSPRRKNGSGQKAVSGPDNVNAGWLPNDGKEAKPLKEVVGMDTPPSIFIYRRAGRSPPSQPTRVFLGAESSQPEYVDLDDTRFLYGNSQG